MAFSLLVTGLLLLLASPVKAICSEENTVCEPFSGQCSQPLLAALGPEPLEAFRNLEYGKYCGQQTCRPLPLDGVSDEDNECVEGSPNCPSAPCDAIDTACQSHDYCLEEDLKDLGLGPNTLGGVPIPRRCLCETQFVYSLSQVETNGQLCDAGYYTFPFPDPKDANLFAATPCCVLLFENDVGERYCELDAKENNYSSTYASAVATCSSLIEAVSVALGGFDVCGVANEIYTIDTGVAPTGPEKCVRRNRAAV